MADDPKEKKVTIEDLSAIADELKREVSKLKRRQVDWENVSDSRENWCDVGSGSGPSKDYVMVNLKLVAIPKPKTSRFLEVFHDGSAPVWVGAMPVTQGAFSTVFDMSKNRIYLAGEVAG